MEVNLVTEALKFMLLGMAMVFLFLIIMIIFIDLQARFLNKFFPDAPKDQDISTTAVRSNKNKIAAIMGAILQHKQSK